MGNIGIAAGGKAVGVSLVWAIVVVLLAVVGAAKIYQDVK